MIVSFQFPNHIDSNKIYKDINFMGIDVFDFENCKKCKYYNYVDELLNIIICLRIIDNENGFCKLSVYDNQMFCCYGQEYFRG